MNKWSTSLPSIISLCNDVQFNFDPTCMHHTTTTTTTTTSSSSNRKGHGPNAGSLTDLSILIQTQPPFINYDQYSNNYNQSAKHTTSFYDTSIEHETTIQTDMSPHEQFVPDDELLQSLVAYADSFDLDASVYSIQNSKHQPTTSYSTEQVPPRRRTQSTTTILPSLIDDDPLVRHKSCDDLSIGCSVTSSSKPTTVIPREEHMAKKNDRRFVPSESHPQFFFATKQNEHDNNNTNNNNKEKQYEDNTTTTGGSKIEWGFSSDTMNEFNKPSTDVFNSYEATTNIGDINLHYLHDLEHFSSMGASMDFSQEFSGPPPPPPPVIIRKKSKDFLMKQQVDIQLLRPPTPPPPAPIIIREVRHKASPSVQPIRIHQKLENNGQIRVSQTPSPIIIRERPPLPPKHEFSSKPTIIYRHLPTPPAQSPSPPTVIFERLRPHLTAVIQKPAPIFIEKWLPYPPEQQRKVIYERASPLPIQTKRHTNGQGKKIIVEYDSVNVIVNKDIKQRKGIKRVSPDQYVKKYGNSLYSNETLNELLNNVNCCSSQIQNEQYSYNNPAQHNYQTYSSMFR